MISHSTHHDLRYFAPPVVILRDISVSSCFTITLLSFYGMSDKDSLKSSHYLEQEYGNNLFSLCSAGCQQQGWQSCTPCMVHVQHVFSWEMHSLYKTRSTVLSLGAVCVVPSPHFSWERGMPWRFFACPKTKRWKTESTKPIFPIFSGQLHR